MGTDREARALAAGGTVTVEDKEYKLRPVRARQLTELERESLKYYKRQYLETFTDNADLLGDSIDLSAKVDEVAKWTLDDLPQKIVHDARNVPVTKKMEKWIVEKYGEKPDGDAAYKAVVTTALDSGDITVEKVKELTGAIPRMGKARFDQWWVTACVHGMISIIRASLNGHAKDEVEGVDDWPLLKVTEAARIVESLTSADLGNG
jgi:hypothetical protein